MKNNHPERVYLNGSDYFQVFLDRHHRRQGGIGNVSRLAIIFNGSLQLDSLEQLINEHSLIPWLASLRLNVSIFFRLPFWKSKQIHQVSIRQHERVYNELIEAVEILHRDIRVQSESPIQFDLIRVKENDVLLFSWNHILMDARGAEIIIEQLGVKSEIKIVSPPSIHISWKERLNQIKTVKDFLIPRVADGIAYLFNREKKGTVVWKTIHFSPSETELIDEHAQQLRAEVTRSHFYLSAAQLAFRKALSSDEKPLWIPVPQDHRKKGQRGPVVSNHVSYLFFLLDANQDTLAKSIASMRNQMMDQMRNRLPQLYHVMMDSMRRCPQLIYRSIVASPTKGGLASFFFSDTGDLLSEVDQLNDVPIKEMLHLPPNSVYPGLTIIFMRRKTRLRIVYSFPESEKQGDKVHEFELELRNLLLNHE